MMKILSKIGTYFMASRSQKRQIAMGGGRTKGSSVNFPFATKPGTSLLVALGLTTIIVLVSIGVTNVIVSSTRDSANATAATLAHYAAESALEEGLLTNQNNGMGYSAPAKAVDFWGTVLCNTAQQAICNNSCNGNQACMAACQMQWCPNVQKSTVTASYTLAGQVPASSKYDDGSYGIPAPGTGNAGAGADGQNKSIDGCDSLHPFAKDSFWYDPDTQKFFATDPGNMPAIQQFAAIDHPCNWGKIGVGETVAIPLYTTTNDPSSCGNTTTPDPSHPGSFICNPSDLDLKKLIIKVRTPCETPKGAVMCPNIDRFDLAYDKNNGTEAYNKTNDTVMSWEIDGTNMGGDKTYTLQPDTEFDPTNQSISDAIGQSKARKEPQNSEIYEALINFKRQAGQDQAAVTVTSVCNQNSSAVGKDVNGTLGFIIDFLKDGTPCSSAFSRAGNEKISKPVLKLSVIHSLESDTQSTIPYLEYQVLVDTPNGQPADVSQTITAEGYSGSFKQVLQVKVPQESGLPDYVIQQ